ncbi:tRNA-specific adenosine deaminase, chloroplastic [Tetrabaena socialis]|uniref:tRNA-specific adenosine deaminase, chloroplastic n=1 Tax=Tetrabaena socialis TaxID=47790 RepID=A0A2J8A9T3_9CHLO|nr:tRNA-specific adenosine deaminase, chloroplastic [Tetrabaena socialis]|eukprot:PNH09287.1 tRNA-specific adenosine deaminase, chloroplastic [Tetrabaena socialis]
MVRKEAGQPLPARDAAAGSVCGLKLVQRVRGCAPAASADAPKRLPAPTFALTLTLLIPDTSATAGASTSAHARASVDADPTTTTTTAALDSAATAATTATATDEAFMSLALLQARAAAAAGEVPVGAVLVHGGVVLAAAHNRVETLRSPLAHAEMLCLASAASRLRAWRLLGATLYVTLEPCAMCAGALLQARVSRVVYGARQPRLGADGSWIQLLPVGSRRDGGGGGGGAGGGGAGGMSAGARSRGDAGCGCDASSGAGYAGGVKEEEEEEEQAWLTPREAIGGDGRGSCGARASTSGRSGRGCASNAAASSRRAYSGSSSSYTSSTSSSDGGWDEGFASTLWADPVAPHPFHDSTVVEGGCLAEQCADLMRDFFRRRRSEQREAKGSEQAEGRQVGAWAAEQSDARETKQDAASKGLVALGVRSAG